jgi:hypothetical protein
MKKQIIRLTINIFNLSRKYYYPKKEDLENNKIQTCIILLIISSNLLSLLLITINFFSQENSFIDSHPRYTKILLSIVALVIYLIIRKIFNKFYFKNESSFNEMKIDELPRKVRVRMLIEIIILGFFTPIVLMLYFFTVDFLI